MKIFCGTRIAASQDTPVIIWRLNSREGFSIDCKLQRASDIIEKNYSDKIASEKQKKYKNIFSEIDFFVICV